MADLTTYGKNELIKHMFRTGSFTKPTNWYLGLISAVTDIASGNVTEFSGNAYARVVIPVSDADWIATIGSNGLTKNAQQLEFPMATGNQGTATHFGLWDAAAAGNLWICKQLVSPIAVPLGNIPVFYAETLTVAIG